MNARLKARRLWAIGHGRSVKKTDSSWLIGKREAHLALSPFGGGDGGGWIEELIK